MAQKIVNGVEFGHSVCRNDSKEESFLEPINLLQSLTSSNNPKFFEFEQQLTAVSIQAFTTEYFTSTVVISAIYIFVIFGGKYFMGSRERFELRGLLALWSFGLAAFSIFGTFKLLPELLEVLSSPNGFYESVCTSSFKQNNEVSFWLLLFILSKVIELGDTVFIVLRKQPLIFLHWYHHVTVLLFSFQCGTELAAPSRWYATVNFIVHSFMYSYYGFKALKFHIPKPIAIAITSGQILQMVVAITVILYALHFKLNGAPCDVSHLHLNAGLLMYTSYFILFAHFFYKAYLSKSSSRKSKGMGSVKKEN